MAKGNSTPSIGAWAYLLGLVIAILAAFIVDAGNASMIAMVLGVLGLVVGLLNVSDKEVMMFLVAGISFLLSASSLGGLGAMLGSGWMATIFANVSVFVAPAVAVVALKAVYDHSKE